MINCLIFLSLFLPISPLDILLTKASALLVCNCVAYAIGASEVIHLDRDYIFPGTYLSTSMTQKIVVGKYANVNQRHSGPIDVTHLVVVIINSLQH